MFKKTFAFFMIVACFFASPSFAKEKISQERADEAAAFISSLGDEALSLLANKDLSDEDRLEEFKALFIKDFDTPYIARLVLGRYWKEATDSEKEEYLSLFDDFIVKIYYNRFDGYSGETLQVIKGYPASQKDATVMSKIIRPDGPPVSLEWRVRTNGDALKIIDVKIEDISMARSQRSEVASLIEKEQKGVEGLLVELRKRVQN